MLDRLKSFASGVAAIAKAHPVLFVSSILLLPLVVGGLTWKLVSLVRRVPVVGSAAASAANAAASATGSK